MLARKRRYALLLGLTALYRAAKIVLGVLTCLAVKSLLLPDWLKLYAAFGIRADHFAPF